MLPLVNDHTCEHIDEYLLPVEQEQLEDFCCCIEVVAVDEESYELGGEAGWHGRLFLHHVQIDRATVLVQIRFQVLDHLVNTGRIVAEDRSPVALEHNVDEAPEGVFLVRHHLQEHSRDKVLPLNVASLAVIGAECLEYVIEAILAGVCWFFEFFDRRESPRQVLLYPV